MFALLKSLVFLLVIVRGIEKSEETYEVNSKDIDSDDMSSSSDDATTMAYQSGSEETTSHDDNNDYEETSDDFGASNLGGESTANLWSCFDTNRRNDGRRIGSLKYCGCNEGAGQAMTAIYRNGCNDLHCIEEFKCAKPQGASNFKTCYNHNIWGAFDRKGGVRCKQDYVLVGLNIHRNSGCNKLSCIEELRCCQYKNARWYGKTEVKNNWWGSFDKKGWSRVVSNTLMTGLYRNSCNELNCLEETYSRYMAVAPTGPYIRWSNSGALNGMRCTQIKEGADKGGTWLDNFLCVRRDFPVQFFWSSSGKIANKRCTQITEPAEPHHTTWKDNYLCVNKDCAYEFHWSYAGAIRGKSCVQWSEPADPHTWHDNYLCWNKIPAKPVSQTPDAMKGFDAYWNSGHGRGKVGKLRSSTNPSWIAKWTAIAVADLLHLQKFCDFFNDVVEALKKAWTGTVQAFNQALHEAKKLGKAIGDVAEAVADGAVSLAIKTAEWAKQAGSHIATGFKVIGNGIVDAAKTTGRAIVDAGRTVGNAIARGATTVGNGIVRAGRTVIRAIRRWDDKDALNNNRDEDDEDWDADYEEILSDMYNNAGADWDLGVEFSSSDDYDGDNDLNNARIAETKQGYLDDITNTYYYNDLDDEVVVDYYNMDADYMAKHRSVPTDRRLLAVCNIPKPNDIVNDFVNRFKGEVTNIINDFKRSGLYQKFSNLAKRRRRLHTMDDNDEQSSYSDYVHYEYSDDANNNGVCTYNRNGLGLAYYSSASISAATFTIGVSFGSIWATGSGHFASFWEWNWGRTSEILGGSIEVNFALATFPSKFLGTASVISIGGTVPVIELGVAIGMMMDDSGPFGGYIQVSAGLGIVPVTFEFVTSHAKLIDGSCSHYRTMCGCPKKCTIEYPFDCNKCNGEQCKRRLFY